MLQEFAQQVEETARDVLASEVHTALPGRIVSFNAATCMATVKPQGHFNISGQKLEYPQIAEVPVVMPYSPSAEVGIVFPVLAKDPCLIIISEVELDEWRTGAQSKASLKFDLSSAMCIVGLMKKSNASIKEANSRKTAIIQSKDTTLKVSSQGVEIEGNLKVNGTITATGSITGA